MANDNNFDEKDALIQAGALHVRGPTPQKARIRRRYARQFQEEANASSVSSTDSLTGGTEGKAIAQDVSGSEAINKAEEELKETIIRRRDRRIRKAANRRSSHFFAENEGSSAGHGTKTAFYSERSAGTASGNLFHESGSYSNTYTQVAYGQFSDGNAAALPKRTSADIQREQIKRSYTAKRDSVYIPVVTKVRNRLNGRGLMSETQKATDKAAEAAEKHPLFLGVLTVALLTVFLIVSVASAGITVVGEVLTASVTATSYSADDEDILGAEADYQALEANLRYQLQHLESLYPGYSQYELQNAEIGHDPYRLAALLTVLFECYTREEVHDTLREIFDLQYTLQTEDITGSSTTKTVRVGESLGVVVTSGYCNCAICCGPWAGGHTTSGVYPQSKHTIAVDMWNPIVPMGTKVIMNGIEYTVEDTGPLERYGVAFDVYYDDHQTAQNHGHKRWEAFLADDNGSQTVTVTVVNNEPTLKVTLSNHGLDYAARELLNADLYERYQLITEMKGNREDLFPDYNALTEYAGLSYAPPGSALSDARFANLYNEAVKYLGTPYVWGGEGPGGFDCSGFVSYVINNCGNGWNFGRLTAEEWRQHTMAVSPAEARPGDLVFFQGTYDTAGASHIGIYLGDGMMIHAGHPVQIASINTPYFQQHLMGFGRIPG